MVVVVRSLQSVTKWGSRISRPRITKFYYNHTGYDVTIYFRSEVTVKKPPQTASGRISQESFKRGSPNFTYLLGTIGPTNLLDMTLLVVPVCCKMQLNTAQKWCLKRVQPKSQIIQPLFKPENQTHQMLHWHPCQPTLQPHWIWRHQLLPIGIYWSSKNGRKCRLRRLWVFVVRRFACPTNWWHLV